MGEENHRCKPAATALQNALDTELGGNALLTEKANKQLKMTRKVMAFASWDLGTGALMHAFYLVFR